MAKGTFKGYIRKDGVSFSPEAIPQVIKQTITDTFINNDNQGKIDQLIIGNKSDKRLESN